MIIYRAVNRETNYSYIGATTQSLRVRKIQHKCVHSKNTRRAQGRIYKAMREFGFDSFDWEVLDTSAKTKEELQKLEMHYIAKLKPEYNSTAGGPGVRNPPKEVRDKMSQAAIGRVFTQEHRESLSKAQRGKEHSEESRRKRSVAMQGKKHSKEVRAKISKAGRGRKHTEEAKEKMRLGNLGKKHSEESRRKMSLGLIGNQRNKGGSLSPETIAKRTFTFKRNHQIRKMFKILLSIHS